MKNVDIADFLDEKYNLFDIGPGAVHTVTKDTATLVEIATIVRSLNENFN